MKKTLFIFLLIFICISPVLSFDFAMGPKGGFTLGFATGDDWKNQLTTATQENGIVPGITTGGFFTFGFMKFFAFQAEALFTTTGYRSKVINSNDNTKIKVYEVSFPALAKFRFPIKKVTLNVFGGAEFAYIFKAYQHFFDTAPDPDETVITEVDGNDYNNLQVRIVMGIGADIQMGKGFLITDFRYCLPISRIVSDSVTPDNNTRLNYLALTAGYGFKIK